MDATAHISDAAVHEFWVMWVRVHRAAGGPRPEKDARYLMARRQWEYEGRPGEVYWWIVRWLDRHPSARR